MKSKIQLIESPSWEEGIPTALSEIMDKLCDALDEKKEKFQFAELIVP